MKKLQSQREGFLETVRTAQSQILLFNELAGNKTDDLSLIPLYENLLLEEAKEFFAAKNVYDIYDAFIDVTVVADFLLRLYGYQDGVMDGQGLNGDGNAHDCVIDFEYLVHLLNQPTKDPAQILDVVQYIILDFGNCYVPHGKLFNEICESNLSKFIPVHCMSVEEAEATCKQIEEDTDYKGVDFTIYNGYYVFRDKDGKIMKKHSNFKDVDLTQYC